jgi:hypothetical protein
LKKIVAKQALEIEFKDELLKKSHWVSLTDGDVLRSLKRK